MARTLYQRCLLGSCLVVLVAATGATVMGWAGESAKEPGLPLSLQAFADVKPVEYPWGWIRWLMNAEIDPAAEMTLGVVFIKANQSNPLHVHPNSAEFLHVLSGSCEHRIGDRWVSLKAGDTLRIPKGVKHSARTAAEPCKVIVVYDTGHRQMVTVEELGESAVRVLGD